jgi:hypothetical protein
MTVYPSHPNSQIYDRLSSQTLPPSPSNLPIHIFILESTVPGLVAHRFCKDGLREVFPKTVRSLTLNLSNVEG